jgi:hypothetical protein
MELVTLLPTAILLGVLWAMVRRSRAELVA